ncbi:MAG: transglutaminase-like domain-containing protein [Sphingomonas sp.]
MSRYAVDVALDYRIAEDSAILLAIEALTDSEQTVIDEEMSLAGVPFNPIAQVPGAFARYRWINAVAGPLAIRYRAEVTVERADAALAEQPATPLSQLPPTIAQYLFASRYCDPAQFQPLLSAEFGYEVGRPGDGALMDRIRGWVHEHIAYEPVSHSGTTAADTLLARAGICRDFAHIMVACARACGVPARFVSSYAWQLSPPDFHAVAELWLGGRWHLVDATGLAPASSLIRIARAEDAVAASFMTIFGAGEMVDQSVAVTKLD